MEPVQASPLEAPSFAAASAPLSPAARVVWGALIVATLAICYFSHLGALGFVGPDEPRYAWIARDMAETGDWVTPRLYGKPWFEKPPLYYWSAALSFKLFGVSEVAARLPSAIAALLATLAVAWLALRLYGSEPARWFLLLLPTSVGMIGFSHAAATDMLFSATLILALVSAANILRLIPNRSASPSSSSSSFTSPVSSTSFTSVLFGFFLGLAVLAKGPAAIVLIGGAVFFWAIFTKRWRDAFRLLHPAALAAFFATALPWYILCARRNPDFFRVFIIEHNFKRYLTSEFQHIQPFWYYGVVLLAAFLPWTALFLWSLISGSIRLWRTRTISDFTLLLLCWSAFTLLFFTISKSKLPGYILPAIPAIALLFSHLFATNLRSKTLAVSLLASGLLFTFGFVAVRSFASHSVGRSLAAGIAAGQVLGILAVANLLFFAGLWLSRFRAVGRALISLSAVPILFAILKSDHFFPAFFYWDPSGRTIALELQRSPIPLDDLAFATPNRGQRYSLSFYLHREIPEWDREHPQKGYVLIGHGLSSAGRDEYERLPFDINKTGLFLYRIKQNQSEVRPVAGR